jgi:hypothetical protein
VWSYFICVIHTSFLVVLTCGAAHYMGYNFTTFGHMLTRPWNAMPIPHVFMEQTLMAVAGYMLKDFFGVYGAMDTFYLIHRMLLDSSCLVHTFKSKQCLLI